MPWRAARPAPTTRPQGPQSRTRDNEARDCSTTNLKSDIIENIVCARIMNVAVTLCAASATVRLKPQSWQQNLSLFFCYEHKVIKKIATPTHTSKVSQIAKGFKDSECPRVPHVPDISQIFNSPKDVKGCTGFKSFQGFGSTEKLKAVRRVKCFRSVEGFENPKATKVYSFQWFGSFLKCQRLEVFPQIERSHTSTRV